MTLLARGSGLLPQNRTVVGNSSVARLADAGIDARGSNRTALGLNSWPSGPRAGPLVPSCGSTVLFCRPSTPGADIGGDNRMTPGSWLDVDDTCRVRGCDDGWLYAAGDVNHRALPSPQANTRRGSQPAPRRRPCRRTTIDTTS